MIANALTTAYGIGCVLCEDVTPAECAAKITSDRLSIVERLRSLADGDMHYVKRMVNEAADILERDIRAAAEEPK